MLFITGKSRFKTVGKFTNKRNRPFISWKLSLLGTVDDLLENEEGDDYGKNCSGGGFAIPSASE